LQPAVEQVGSQDQRDRKMLIRKDPLRRTLLRGILGGVGVSVALPFLEVFLDTHGEARADGLPLPTYFGTWYHALGFTPGFWEPKTVGANYENAMTLKALDPIKHKVTVFSGMRVGLDANFNAPHITGAQVGMGGGVPKPGLTLPTIDNIVADHVGRSTRFRLLDVRCDGSNVSQSRRSETSVGVAEPSPLALYKRIFGAEFKDPNAADFTPDPVVLARKSVLSAISERRAALNSSLGAADKARLDEYFTSLRELENQLALRTQKPAPALACTLANEADYAEAPHGTDVRDAMRDHEQFARLIAHAVACDQTRVFNVQISSGGGGSGLRRPGESATFHTLTHEEAFDLKTGYQPTVMWFQQETAKAYAQFATIFDSFKIGDQTLLDRSLIMFYTDVGKAQIHDVENMPVMLAGSAGGRVKTGLHVPAKGQPVTRVGLTAQMAMGVPTSEWGTESNHTNKPMSEVLV
jgi:hypothetical protein